VGFSLFGVLFPVGTQRGDKGFGRGMESGEGPDLVGEGAINEGEGIEGHGKLGGVG
jgi:hypothetical protein